MTGSGMGQGVDDSIQQVVLVRYRLLCLFALGYIQACIEQCRLARPSNSLCVLIYPLDLPGTTQHPECHLGGYRSLLQLLSGTQHFRCHYPGPAQGPEHQGANADLNAGHPLPQLH